MTVETIVAAARASRNWAPLVDLVPFARFLDVRLDIRGEQYTACMPFHQKLIGNPALPALHGGAIGGFLECAGLFYLLWDMDSVDLPKTINFTFEYLRSGRPVDTYANVFMVKQGKRVAHLRVEAWQSSPDTPISVGHGNFMLKPAAISQGNP
ncbi:PaaI family thioesterase [Ramlibacter albus]|uniref:PaaI family thioesterase n=1 Tax=Ramlibacter albus TaxID=2079448 RepID=A0A923S3B6_9BURK|nr:PaaI family thioesterase [Ramlibacter albus]MBC5762952.1 PaaI family thioesterase [Ramlibacter albus]